MRTAWEELIIPKLKDTVKVSFVRVPVGGVYEIFEDEEESPTLDTYRIYGGTADMVRFPQKYLERKFPNVAGRIVNVAAENQNDFERGRGPSPMAKGEWIRKTIDSRNLREFQKYLPEFLKSSSDMYMSLLLG